MTIIAVDIHGYLGPVAQRLGADLFTIASGSELIEMLGEHTKAKVHRPSHGLPWLLGGVDRVYDAVGSARTLEIGLRLVRASGSVVVVGVANPARFEWTPLYFKEVHLIGSSGCGIETIEDAKRHGFSLYLELLKKGRIDPGELVTHRFPLTSYKDAFVAARDKQAHSSLKVLFDFSGTAVEEHPAGFGAWPVPSARRSLAPHEEAWRA